MWDSAFAFSRIVQEWTGYFALMLLVVVMCWPIERLVPRIAVKKTSARRVLAIAGISLVGLVVVQAYAWWAQQSVIDVFIKLKFFSLSKLPIPDWLLIVVSLLLLDFLYYLAHLISHHVRPLWQLHKIHHADEHVTAFSALLHHPFEPIYTALFITGFAVMLGVPVVVFVYFGLALAVHAVLSHADVSVPEALDRKLRLLVVTPDVHRTHHSQDMAEGNSNFGAMLVLWDRLFGTYVGRPREPLNQLSMGLPAADRPSAFSVKELLLFPFRSERGNQG